MISFFVYNANLNYFGAVKNVLEFTAGGKIFSSYAYRIFRLTPFLLVTDYIIFAFSLILLLYLIYYSYKIITHFLINYKNSTIKKFFYDGRIIGKPLWNFIDFLIILLFFWSSILRLIFMSHPYRGTFQINDGNINIK
jgi:hypothetical protein